MDPLHPPSPEYLAESRVPLMRIAYSVPIPLCLISTALRLWAEFQPGRRGLAFDDYLMMFATVIIIGQCLQGAVVGPLIGVGRHVEAVTPDQYPKFAAWIHAYNHVSNFATVSSKLSVLALFYRVLPKHTFQSVVLWTAFIFTMWLIAYEVMIIVVCHYEKPNRDPGVVMGQCMDTSAFALSNNITNLMMDVWLFLLPIPITSWLKVSRKKKIGISVLFSLGLITCGIGATRLYIQITEGIADITWSSAKISLLAVWEPCATIICANLPLTYKPVALAFRKLIGRPVENPNRPRPHSHRSWYQLTIGRVRKNNAHLQISSYNDTLDSSTVDLELTNTSRTREDRDTGDDAGHKNLQFLSKRDANIFDHGSYVVDHFDAKGAAVVTDFWRDHILTDEVSNLLSKAGHYAWEDSLEVIFNVTWSRSLPRRFRAMHSYSIKPYLPLLAFPLVAGYQEYLDALVDWAHNTLGVQLSTQPAYGSVMDTLATVPNVDAPECESLSFNDNIDLYRAFSGPARLSGKRVVSNEIGAVRSAAYSYHLPKLLFSVNRAFVGGVNQFVLHGQSYSGPYPNTTWPGHTPFSYLFSDAFSPNLPIWRHGLKDVLDYISRGQHVLQNSVSKSDVVFYHKESATTLESIYQGDDLLTQGYSWNYLSSDNLQLSPAKIRDRVLARDGPAWKAFVVESSQNLTLSAVRALKSYSREGFPVILSGGVPGFFQTGSRVEYLAFKKELSRSSYILELPRVELHANGTAYTTWSERSGISYAVIYSDINRPTGSCTKTTTTIPISIAGTQTLFLAFSDRLQSKIAVPSYHVTEAPASHILGAVSTNDRKISLHVPHSDTPSHAILNTGKRIPINTKSIPPALQLSHWILTAEHWEAPADLYDLTTAKHNTTHYLPTLTS
ncbi:hypothetical protein BJX70DRAFT_398686 [Aspergillus crustosus]